MSGVPDKSEQETKDQERDTMPNFLSSLKAMLQDPEAKQMLKEAILTDEEQEKLSKPQSRKPRQHDYSNVKLEVFTGEGVTMTDAEKKIAEATKDVVSSVSSRPEVHIVYVSCSNCGAEQEIVRGSILDRKPFRCNDCTKG